MGCRLSKNETKPNDPSETTNTMARHTQDDRIDFKARLERKLCLAKETPEPDFDLSECNLKEVPSSVFVLCRVLRKEVLNLSYNKISDFVAGPLSDLALLRELNLRHNRIKNLPDCLFRLENLRELLVSDNLLVRLPKSINGLKCLELLDVANNNIESIEEINCMPALRILNVSGNGHLNTIPTTLSTCSSLKDLILDEDTIQWPPPPVIAGGTANILQFLTTGESTICDVEVAREAKEAPLPREDALIKELVERDRRSRDLENKMKYIPFRDDYYGNENALIERLQIQQQKQKEELLQAVLLQQNETEGLVNKLQQQKDHERDALIKDIRAAEERANLVIEQLLALRTEPDASLQEKERINEERLLEKLHLEHAELRKQEILATMIQVLHDEDNKFTDYQQQRDNTSKDILEREQETSKQLQDFFHTYEKTKSDIIQQLCIDEELQKQAVAKLIEMNDARTWGLVEQLKIVEMQLANMTQFEIDKKRFTSVEQMNELSEKRLRLTYVLMDLLEQQESRKKELLDTLLIMEAQKHNEEDFWLLQYQRLIDSQPLRFSIKSASIDPLLGYNFLVNGVIHCLPFLQKLWQDNNISLENITEENLTYCGVKQEKDRKLILKSISDYLNENKHSLSKVVEIPTAPICVPSSSSTSETIQQTTSNNESSQNDSEMFSECVICMERAVKTIFIPCGHMCCCSECQGSVKICPMCRSNIERKIKVLQP